MYFLSRAIAVRNAPFALLHEVLDRFRSGVDRGKVPIGIQQDDAYVLTLTSPNSKLNSDAL
jgi:hypothetical protein